MHSSITLAPKANHGCKWKVTSDQQWKRRAKWVKIKKVRNNKLARMHSHTYRHACHKTADCVIAVLHLKRLEKHRKREINFQFDHKRNRHMNRQWRSWCICLPTDTCEPNDRPTKCVFSISVVSPFDGTIRWNTNQSAACAHPYARNHSLLALSEANTHSRIHTYTVSSILHRAYFCKRVSANALRDQCG